MSQQQAASRTANRIGFAVGAICAIAIAIYLFLPGDSARPAAGAQPDALAASAAPAAPAGDSHAARPAEGARPASPHTFPNDRQATAGPPLLSGTLSLDSSITQNPGARVTVFLIARTGPGKGHPVLARRIDVDSFPVTFSMSAADSMMAGERPARVSLEARIDLDGDAMTREPGSPMAQLSAVPMGSSGIGLTLKPGSLKEG